MSMRVAQGKYTITFCRYLNLMRLIIN